MYNSVFERGNLINVHQFIFVMLIAVLPFLGGCGEDDDHEDEIIHADADGFVLNVDGNEVYRQFEGEHNGGITLSVGDEIEVHVLFLDANEEEFDPTGDEEDEHEDDGHDHDTEDEEVNFALGLSEYDDEIIEIHLHGDTEEDEHSDDEHADEEDHGDEHSDDEHADEEDEHSDDEHADEESAMSFEVVGLKAGNTEIKLQLLHGDHPDYTGSLLIPVTVE